VHPANNVNHSVRYMLNTYCNLINVFICIHAIILIQKSSRRNVVYVLTNHINTQARFSLKLINENIGNKVSGTRIGSDLKKKKLKLDSTLRIQGDSEISLEKKPVIGDDEKKS
jgi:hypothetical protein